MRRDQGRPGDLGGPLLSRDHRSRDRRGAARRREGELVFTTLTKEALPVIRYRTRDLTRLLAADGALDAAHGTVTGRSDDMLIIRGVNVFPSQIEAVLARRCDLAPHYMLELRRPDRLDELDVVVETRPTPGGSCKLSSWPSLSARPNI